MTQSLRDYVWDILDRRAAGASSDIDRDLPGQSGSNQEREDNAKFLLLLEHGHTLRGWDIEPNRFGSDVETNHPSEVSLRQDGKWMYVGERALRAHTCMQRHSR